MYCVLWGLPLAGAFVTEVVIGNVTISVQEYLTPPFICPLDPGTTAKYKQSDHLIDKGIFMNEIPLMKMANVFTPKEWPLELTVGRQPWTCC